MKVARRKAASAGDRHETLPELKGLETIVALADLPGEMVYIGSDSGFVFVGTPKEFVRDENLLDWAYSNWADAAGNFKGFADRRVRLAYRRFLGGAALIVEGDERGACWTREEYEEWRAEATKAREAGKPWYWRKG